MGALLYRTRVSVLWLVVTIAMVTSLLLHLFLPGAVEEMVAGEMEGEPLTETMTVFFASVGLVPLVMAGVTVLLGDRVDRLVNLIVGLAFGAFGVFAVISHLLAGDVNVHVLMVAVAGIGALLIAGLSLAELRHSPSESPAPEPESRLHHEATTV